MGILNVPLRESSILPYERRSSMHYFLRNYNYYLEYTYNALRYKRLINIDKDVNSFDARS